MPVNLSNQGTHDRSRARRCRRRSRKRARATSTRWPWATRWEMAQLEAERCLQCAKPHCVDGLPGRRAHPAVHQGAARRRHGRRGRGDEGQEQPAGHLRPRLPAGVAVRGDTACWRRRASRSPSAGWSASSATSRCASTPARAVPAPPTGRKVAVVGSGPAGLTCAVDLAQAGPQGDHLRVAAPARRRADLRHPGVPSAQEHHPGRRSRPRPNTWASRSAPTTSSATPTRWTSC